MFHYRRAVLTLIAASALALTTIGVPAAFADEADATQASSPEQGANDSPVTIIVQLEDENLLPKRETAHAAGYDLKVAVRTVIAPGEIASLLVRI